MNKPEEHFLWALHGMPTIAGTGGLSHPAILKRWSQHLWECGFVHRDWVAARADEDGKFDVNRLPPQTIKKIPAVRGQRHVYNNAVTWIPVDQASPAAMRIPDVRQFTMQENEALVRQLEAVGAIKKPPVPQHLAEEEN